MTKLLSEQRRECLSVLKDLYDARCEMICRGVLRYDSGGGRFLFENFMEVCGILLFVGDVFGYMTMNADGVVDPLRSYVPFLERFLVCLEITHLWCMRHPPLGVTPKSRAWVTGGVYPKIINSVAPLSRHRMVQAVWPGLKLGEVLPEGMTLQSDFELRGLFLHGSRSILEIVEQGSYGQCEPLRFTQDIRSVEVYLITRRVKDTLDNGFKQQHEVSIRLSSTFDAMELCEEKVGPVGPTLADGWELYWQLESYSPMESLYQEVKELMECKGFQVMSWSSYVCSVFLLMVK